MPGIRSISIWTLLTAAAVASASACVALLWHYSNGDLSDEEREKCAVVDAFLHDVDQSLNGLPDETSLKILALSPILEPALVRTPPGWIDWRPFDGTSSQLIHARLELESFTRLGDDHLSRCSFNASENWQSLYDAGWINAHGGERLISPIGYVLLRISPVYLSPDGDMAILAASFDLERYESDFEYALSSRGSLFRLERRSGAEWAVTGTNW